MKRNNDRSQQQPLRILVVEDHPDMAANIGEFLEERGHRVDYAMDGVTGLHLAITQPLDVIVLDIMLPGMDGLTLCRRLREETASPTPVLMLTAKDTLEDKLEGFDAGADDYLLKPFALEELEVRLQALVRRAAGTSPTTLSIGNLQVDTASRQVTRGGTPVPLNRTCFTILVELMRRSPGVVTRDELEMLLWGDFKPASDVLRSHIYTLRKALDDGGQTSLIETVVGVGFRMGGTT